MSRADYAHWNEEQDHVWWEEEGKHQERDAESTRDEFYDAADAYAEELGEMDNDQLEELLHDDEYLGRWPKAKTLIEWEINHRKEQK